MQEKYLSTLYLGTAQVWVTQLKIFSVRVGGVCKFYFTNQIGQKTYQDGVPKCKIKILFKGDVKVWKELSETILFGLPTTLNKLVFWFYLEYLFLPGVFLISYKFMSCQIEPMTCEFSLSKKIWYLSCVSFPYHLWWTVVSEKEF